MRNFRNTIIVKIAIPPRRVLAAVCRELDGVHEWLAEQQEATRQRGDQARAQMKTLNQLLPRLNEMANPSHSAQPAPQGANPVALEVPYAVNQVGEPVYERFRHQKPPQSDGIHDLGRMV